MSNEAQIMQRVLIDGTFYVPQESDHAALTEKLRALVKELREKGGGDDDFCYGYDVAAENCADKIEALIEGAK